MADAATSPVFWLLAAVILASAIAVVSLKNIFHCALALVSALFGVAGIYVLLHAEFLAAAQVLIYVGAVAILMIFAVMLTADLSVRKIVQTNRNALAAFFVCIVFAMGAYVMLRATDIWYTAEGQLPEKNVETVGRLIMTQYMLPFEVVSILLLAALIGAVVLARGERS
jgi:NADH-quinone oxidoreductase subunit J